MSRGHAVIKKKKKKKDINQLNAFKTVLRCWNVWDCGHIEKDSNATSINTLIKRKMLQTL